MTTESDQWKSTAGLEELGTLYTALWARTGIDLDTQVAQLDTATGFTFDASNVNLNIPYDGLTRSWAQSSDLSLYAFVDVVDAATDVTNGTNDADTLTALDTSFLNELTGKSGHDVLYGGDGNDKLYGGAGQDKLYGGAGRDILYGGGDNDLLYGGDGNNTIYGGGDSGGFGGDYALLDGSSSDYSVTHVDDYFLVTDLTGGTGVTTIYDDVEFIHFSGDSHEFETSQFESSIFNQKTLSLDGSATNLLLTPEQAEGSTINGTDGADSLTGTTGDDSLYGLDGSDTLQSLGGEDFLQGNQDPDRLLAGDGADTIRGGQGDDSVLGEGGADSLYGDIGSDKIWGGDGDDYVNGGRISSYAGDDDDTIYGEAGDDFIQGNLANDKIYGGDGNDALRGGGDNDTLYGEAGDDTLGGDKGDDLFYGGEGDSDVVFLKGSVTDYTYYDAGDGSGGKVIVHNEGIYGTDTIAGDVEYGVYEEGDVFLWIMI